MKAAAKKLQAAPAIVPETPAHHLARVTRSLLEFTDDFAEAVDEIEDAEFDSNNHGGPKETVRMKAAIAKLRDVRIWIRSCVMEVDEISTELGT
jgi:hypothetical protein